MENIIYIWITICTLVAIIGFLCMIFNTDPITIFWHMTAVLIIGALVSWCWMEMIGATVKITMKHAFKPSKS